MGHIGKLSRGLKWWKYNRDRDGVLQLYISDDYDKMKDVNHYLNYIKDKEQEKVDVALMKYFMLTHAKGGKKSMLFRNLVKQLNEGDFKKTISKPVSKK